MATRAPVLRHFLYRIIKVFHGRSLITASLIYEVAVSGRACDGRIHRVRVQILSSVLFEMEIIP